VTLSPVSDVTSFDPGRTVDGPSQFWLGHVFEGLTTHDAKGAIVPAAAKTFATSKDGTVVTITLRPDLRWHDGAPVRAADFEYAWKRVATPAYASEYAFVFETARIRNASSVISGKATPDSLGVKAVSDSVLRVELDGPSALLPELLSLNVFFPVRRNLVERYGARYGQDKASLLGNGPYRVSSWTPEASVVIEKATTWRDPASLGILSISAPLATTSFTTAYQSYLAGGVDLLTNMDSDVFRLAQKAGKSVRPLSAGAQWWLVFNQRQGTTLSSRELREATARAIDRRQYIDKVHALPGARAALGLVPDYVFGSTFQSRFRSEHPLSSTKPDFKRARTLSEQGKRRLPGGRLPAIRFLGVGNESNKTEAEWFQQMLARTHDVDVRLDLLPFKVRMQRMRDGQFDVAMASWIPDYNDALTFLEIFHSSSASNSAGYANPAFDSLIEKARGLARGKERTRALAQAEALLLNDAVVVPYRQSAKLWLARPGLEGVVRRALGVDPDFRYARWK
jgi:oligopeptide transport system substrate-binding protein